MYVLLDHALKYVVKCGSLHVVDGRGKSHRYGDGSGESLKLRVNDRAARRIAFDTDVALGECYMDGSLAVERGTIFDVLALFLRNLEGREPTASVRFFARLRGLTRNINEFNTTIKARRNVSHHYDLNGALYDLFLDRDRQYSCAYFERPDQSLEEAQLAKKRHLAAKLKIEPGMKVLDIGSGWGGLGIYLAEACGATVVGVTLSEEQHKLSNERAQLRGVASNVEFRLLDYRELGEKFDRIVSVGMFEHVGAVQYRAFFRKCSALLADDGVAVLHSINRSDGPSATGGWINKYIFPGGAMPALSEVVPILEREKLYITDIEILRLHYAETLKHWRRRFADNRERAEAIYDERFCRMWEYYLAVSETAFRYWGLNNFQIQFCKNQHALPMTRDYIRAEEERLRGLDTQRPRLKSVP